MALDVSASIRSRRLPERSMGLTRQQFQSSSSQPRVEQDIGDISQKAHQQENGSSTQNDGLDDGIVAAEDAVDDHFTETRYAEDLFSQHGTGQKLAKLQCPEGHNRNQRIGQGMPQHDH